MEKQIKGGYILVSLGLIALSTLYSGSIDYDRISRTKKHIVLTGIKVADTVMPDICVKPVYGNGTITFEDVYGFDIVISSDNSVSVSEHPQPSSGVKFIELSENDGTIHEDEILVIATKIVLPEPEGEQDDTTTVLSKAFADDILPNGGHVIAIQLSNGIIINASYTRSLGSNLLQTTVSGTLSITTSLTIAKVYYI